MTSGKMVFMNKMIISTKRKIKNQTYFGAKNVVTKSKDMLGAFSSRIRSQQNSKTGDLKLT